MSNPRCAVVLGTRPEAIKLAPVIRELGCDAVVISTGQHSDLLYPLLGRLGVTAHVDFHLMRPSQTLHEVTSGVITGLVPVFSQHEPDVVVVQGDTTTAMAAALSAHMSGLRVAHVEAGLRSGNLHSPFPEEANRRIISSVAQWHYAPTQGAAEHLRASQVDGYVVVTGNTVIDNLYWALDRGIGTSQWRTRQRRLLVTMHRRENHGAALTRIASAIETLTEPGGVEVLIPRHPNPALNAVLDELERVPGVRVIDPLDYFDFVATLHGATVVLTDSGGVQEEATALAKPMVILRDTTERPESITAGSGVLAGTDPQTIVAATTGCLTMSEPSPRPNPFGDGHAAQRIVAHLRQTA